MYAGTVFPIKSSLRLCKWGGMSGTVRGTSEQAPLIVQFWGEDLKLKPPLESPPKTLKAA